MKVQPQYHSQAGQDEFVFKTLNGKTDGHFVDIGSAFPVVTSNSYFLEQIGWSGLCVDKDEYDYSGRSCTFKQADALSLCYERCFELMGFPLAIDYLSLDIDDATFDCLAILPHHRYHFKTITIEHDTYRLGEKLRGPERELLSRLGYRLQRPDVICDGLMFEDWWVHPNHILTP